MPEYSGSTEKWAWQYLSIAADVSHELHRGEQPVTDPLYEGMKALLCKSLAFEGFVNWLGEQVCPKHWWQAIERRLNVRAKIELIADECNIKLDFGAPPFQKWNQIKAFRDSMAHPRLTTSTADYALPSGELARPSRNVLVDWESECTSNLKKNLDALEDMKDQMLKATKRRLPPLARGAATRLD